MNAERVLVALCFLAYADVSPAQSDCTEAARQAFDRQHWEAVESRLAAGQSNQCDQRLFSLALFQLQKFDIALPRVNALLEERPDDVELNRASLVMLTALDRTGEARERIAHLASIGDSDFADLYRARLLLQEGDRKGAENLLRPLLDARDPALSQEAAEELITLLQASGRHREVLPVAAKALERDPQSFSAYRFEQYSLENQRGLTPLEISLGYRLEYDDNVALLPDEQGLVFGTADEEDFRHVLFADLLYARPLIRHLRWYAEGHFSHSIHQDLDEYDFTRANLLAGVGGAYAAWGWRLPVEYSHDRFDGSSFRDSLAIAPGAYLDIWGGLQSHVYLRYQSEDYERIVSESEDRSGDTSGGGVLVAGTLGERWFLRVFAEVDEFDTDGDNWDRDEWRVQAQAELTLAPDWALGAGFRYQEADFDNVHDVFLTRRKDETGVVFAGVSYSFRERWQFRAQVSYVDQESTLSLYDFDRTVVSLAVSYDF